jgi:hypothetical protein
MPFYASSIKLGFEGFCPPGIGIHRYADVATALMDILPRVMPEQISRLGKLIVVIQADSNNGYYLMWRVMALGAPGFDPTLHVASLVWEDYLDIFNFCRAHILYFCLQAKQELYYNERTHSTTFLCMVQQTEYMEVMTTLQTNIDLFQVMDPGYLPPRLCMMELADRIDKSAKARVHQYDRPWAHRIQGGKDWHDMSQLLEPQIQGYSPVALCMDISGCGCAYCNDCGQRQTPQDTLALHG